MSVSVIVTGPDGQIVSIPRATLTELRLAGQRIICRCSDNAERQIGPFDTDDQAKAALDKLIKALSSEKATLDLTAEQGGAPPPAISVENVAKAFVEYTYVEVKDLGKQFLTVVAAVLALSVTFADKIANFEHAALGPRVMLIAVWGFCLLAFFLGGAGIFFAYNAGALAKQVTLDHSPRPEMRRLFGRAHWCLTFAGAFFVIALILLGLISLLKLIESPLPPVTLDL